MPLSDAAKDRFRKSIFWICAAAWIGLIYAFSAQDGSQSASLSGGLVKALLSIYPGYDRMSVAEQARLMSSLHFLIRKGAHMTVYFVLAIFTTLAVNMHRLKRSLTLLIPLLICLVNAAADEFHQSFVPGRGPQFRDVCIDFAGAVIGVALTSAGLAIWRRHKRLKQQKPQAAEPMVFFEPPMPHEPPGPQPPVS